MHYIYLDEAGISASEPITVVAGVMIHADSQWRDARRAVAECIARHVPKDKCPSFIFHAKDIYSGGREREDWPFQARLAFLEDFLAIPKQLRLPVAFAAYRPTGRGRFDSLSQRIQSEKLSFEEYRHLEALAHCLARADQFLAMYAPPFEVGTAIAEDSVGSRRFLRHAKHWIHMDGRGLVVKPLPSPHTPREDVENGVTLRITRIVDEVMFTGKHGSAMLQLADACAFAIRRFYTELKHGHSMMRALTNADVTASEFTANFMTGVLLTDPPGWAIGYSQLLKAARDAKDCNQGGTLASD